MQKTYCVSDARVRNCGTVSFFSRKVLLRIIHFTNYSIDQAFRNILYSSFSCVFRNQWYYNPDVFETDGFEHRMRHKNSIDIRSDICYDVIFIFLKYEHHRTQHLTAGACGMHGQGHIGYVWFGLIHYSAFSAA